MLHTHFIYRQLTTAKKQSFIFILCVALSIVTLVALRGFGESVNRTLVRDAKQLHAADIMIESNFPISDAVVAEVDGFVADGQVESTRLYEFYSVVRVADGEETLLTNLKVVEEAYPFYGEVTLASGRPLDDVLVSGNAIVEPDFLERLGLSVGDQLHVGEMTLTISDIVLYEPDRPVNFFSLGPRMFVSADDLAALDLVKAGSRVDYSILLKVNNERSLETITEQIQAAIVDEQEEVETYLTAESGVQRFLDNLLFFLNLVGIFTLLLAGIGIQSSLTAFLREQDKSIAIIKTLGATSRFVTTHYYAIVCFLGLIGTAIGLGLGLGLQRFLPTLLAGLLPPNMSLVISQRTILESLLLGVVIVISFTFMPLYHLQELRPSFIFRKEYANLQRGVPYYMAIVGILIFFVGMVLWQLQNIQVGLYFILGVLGLLMISSALTFGVLFFLKRSRLRSLAARQALNGLFRPRNATRAIIITLSTALAAIFTIYLIEQNLDANFVQSYPEDTPNVLFLDIQPDQVADFAVALGVETEFYPVIRANVTEVKGVPLDREAESERPGDNLGRAFNLTYREYLLDDEELIAGENLFNDSWDEVSVSVLDYILEDRALGVGDMLTFRIQGIPVKARISSVRTRTTETLRPFFVFLFPTDVLIDAPQTIFTSLQIEDVETIPALQNRLVAQFPNVSVINITESVEQLSNLVRRLSQVIRFFSLFSIVAGILIIISSVFATRLARIQEAVYYKVLGAKSRFVLQVFTMENLFLGLISSVLALLMAQAGSWAISKYLFEIDYAPFVGASILLVVGTMLIVTTVGLAASVSILKSKPIIFLREQTEE